MRISQKKAGVILSYCSQLIHILTGLLYTPVMLRLLGQSEYGLYQLVNSVVSYLGLLSMGFSSSYMRFYSRYKADGEDKKIAGLNGMFLTIFIVISVVCLLCGGVMITNIESIFSDGLTAAEYSTARILMGIMVFNLALTFPNSVFDCFTSSQEQFVFQRGLIVLKNILNPFLTLPLLLMGYGSVGMVAITTILMIATLLINIWFCLKKIKINISFTHLDFKLLKEMFVFTIFIFINMIVDRINWSVGKLLLGRMVGTVAVAIYGIGDQINIMYMSLSTSISSVFVPKINKIVAETGDNLQLTKIFTKVGRVQFLLLALILSGFVFFGKEFISFWVGTGYENSYMVTLLLIVPVTVPLIQNIGIEIQRAKNKHQVRAVAYFLIALSNIFISIPCIKLWGECGAAVGTAVSLFVGNVLFMNWYYHNKMGIDIIYFWKNILSFVPALIAPVIFGVVINVTLNLNNVYVFLFTGCIYVAIYVISVWLWGLDEEEKNLLRNPMNAAVLKWKAIVGK